MINRGLNEITGVNGPEHSLSHSSVNVSCSFYLTVVNWSGGTPEQLGVFKSGRTFCARRWLWEALLFNMEHVLGSSTF